MNRILIGSKNDISGKEKEIDSLLEKYPKISLKDINEVFKVYPYHRYTVRKREEILAKY